MSRPGWTTVHVFATRFDAELAASALRSADIPTHIDADDLGGTLTTLAGARVGAHLQVPTAFAEDARALLESEGVEHEPVVHDPHAAPEDGGEGVLANPLLRLVGRAALAVVLAAIVWTILSGNI